MAGRSQTTLGITVLPLLLAWQALLAPIRAQDPPAPVDLASLPHRRVCISEYTAMDHCGVNGTVDGFCGYEPELFKQVAHLLASQGRSEWAPGNWSFTCLTKLPTIAEREQLCDVVANGVTRGGQGAVKFSYSTYQSGYRIMIHQGNSTSIWTFLDAFQPGVWLLMFGCAVVVALAVLVLEVPWSGQSNGTGSQQQQAGPSAAWLWNKYSNIQWSASGMMVQGVHQLSPNSSGARVVVLGTALVSALLACMYTSAYTAFLTVNSLRAQVSSMSDLTSLPVGIPESNGDLFKRYGLQNVKLLQWDTAADEPRMLRMLRSGEISALVIDAPWADYQTSVNCDLFEVGEMLMPMNHGFMFPAGVPDAYILLFDHAIQSLQSSGEMARLQNQFVRIRGNCPYRRAGSDMDTQIKLKDVGGVWVFVACCIGLGMLWHLVVLLMVRYGPSTRRQKQLPVSQGQDKKVPEPPQPPTVDDAVTVDERVQAINARMDRISQQLRSLPMAFAATMDAQLSELCSEVAAVLVKSTQLKEAKGRAAETPQSNANSGGHPHLTPVSFPAGSLEEHLALITSKFNRMQDMQQKN